MTSVVADHTLRWVVRLVVVLNLAYFGIEFAVAGVIGSVSLFADSIDFLEDASVNLLILDGAQARARRHGARGYPARAGPRHPLDGMGKVQSAGRA
jgi:Co/Zn/Cd efflux system component